LAAAVTDEEAEADAPASRKSRFVGTSVRDDTTGADGATSVEAPLSTGWWLSTMLKLATHSSFSFSSLAASR
jgi:hypothetical protein